MLKLANLLKQGAPFQHWRTLYFSSRTVAPVLNALLVGLLVGCAAVLFEALLKFAQQLFFVQIRPQLAGLGRWDVIFLPIGGALLCALVSRALLGEAKGHGVPEAMEAVALHNGRMATKPALVRGFLSAINIGSGGSAGPEGPIVQIGAALGSLYGQRLGLSSDQRRNLLACGAAAGIAVVFNAPVAGVFFALEAILMQLDAGAFANIVLAAVAASVVGQIFLGQSPAFLVPTYELVSPVELLLYVWLGGLAALAGVALIRLLYWMEARFAALRAPWLIKPLLGALAVGLIGSVSPQVLGSGHEVIESILYLAVPWRMMVALVVLKIVATSLTLGSGSPGGIFAPALVIGAALGGSLGTLVHFLWPTVTATAPAYALVGMAALLAATVRAPIAAILLVFELTRNYTIILPLMAATVMATLIASLLEPESIYTLALRQHGIDLRAGRDFNVMRTLLVREAMTPVDQLPVARADMPLYGVLRLLEDSHHHGLAVLDAADHLYGIITITDLEQALAAGKGEATVGEICTRNVRVIFPHETLEDAMRHFAALDVGRLPVVSRDDPHCLVGMLRRNDIIRAYATTAFDVQARRQRLEIQQWEMATGAHLHRFSVTENAAVVGRALRDLALPGTALIVTVKRGEQTVIPRGDTVLLAGDELIVLANGTEVQHLAEQLQLQLLPQ